MNFKNKIELVITRTCLIILILFGLSICLRIGCRVIVKTGHGNAFTNLVFFDNSILRTSGNEEGSPIKFDFEKEYPFYEDSNLNNIIINEKPKVLVENVMKKIRKLFDSYTDEKLIGRAFFYRISGYV